MQYVYLDDDGIPVYEKESALADGISDSIIEVADNYFDILNQYYTYENGNKTRMSVPILAIGVDQVMGVERPLIFWI